MRKKPEEETEETPEGPDPAETCALFEKTDLVCDIPVGYWEALRFQCVGKDRRSLAFIFAKCNEFQKKHAKLQKKCENLERQLIRMQETLSPGLTTDQYRDKVAQHVRQIPPELVAQALEGLLRDQNPWALKNMSDILGLAVQAKEQAIDDRPPAITFEYTTTEEPAEPVGDTAQPQADASATSVRRPQNPHRRFWRREEGRQGSHSGHAYPDAERVVNDGRPEAG